MYRHLFSIIAGLTFLVFLTACGGVASNPTSPNFNQGNQGGPNQQQGAQGEQTGETTLPPQLGGSGEEPGREILQGSFDQLWPQGLNAMENGQVVNAAQFFMSAYAADNQSAEAALAYAVTDVMRNHRKYTVFMHPAVDRLFMNTPLTGHAEAWPNPFLTEDSYFLRLAALGNNASKINPMVQYPIVGPADSEIMFNPETLDAIANMQTEMQMHAPREVTETGPAGPAGDTSTTPPPGDPENPAPRAPTDNNPGNMMEPVKHPEAKIDPVKQAGSLGGGGGGGGGGGDDRGGSDPEGRMFGGMTGEMGGIEQVPVLPEAENAISEDMWGDYIRNYRDKAWRDGADIILSANFYENLNEFHTVIQEHISNLEAVQSIAETEGFMLTLPFNALDGTQKVTMQFDVDDYHLVLDYYRMLDIMLRYVKTYGTQLNYFLTSSAPEDTDGDMILTPAEYLPAAPYGVLADNGAEVLGGLLSEFTINLSALSIDMEPIIDKARVFQAGDPEPKELFFLSSFHRTFVLIEDWTQLLQDISEKSSSGHAIKLAAGDEVEDIVVVYDELFLNPITDIRDPLPSFDAVTMEVITDEDGNFSSDPTFGGFFSEGLTSIDTFMEHGMFRGIIFDSEMNRASGSTIKVGRQEAEADVNGLVKIFGVSLNQLVGNPYTITDESGTEVETGAVRTLYELLPLFDVRAIAVMLNPRNAPPDQGEPRTASGEDGMNVGLGEEGLTRMSPDEIEPDESGDNTADESGDGAGGDDEKVEDDGSGDDKGDEGDTGEGEDDKGDDEKPDDNPGTTGTLG